MDRSIHHRFFTLVLLLCHVPLLAQYGAVDPFFNPLDDGTYGDGAMRHHSYNTPAIGEVDWAYELPDGRILIAGNYSHYNGRTGFDPGLIFPDGQLDESFAIELPNDVSVMSVTRLLDGKLLVYGQSGSIRAVWRVFEDGGIDPDFITELNSPVNRFAELPDGRIIIGGTFSVVNGSPVSRIARLLQDGSLDTTFDAGHGVNNSVNALLHLADGSLLIGGNFTLVDSIPRKGLARLLPDGSLDMAFDPMTGVAGNVSVGALTLDDQGRILVGGQFQLVAGGTWNNLLRLLPDGQPDESFNVGSGPSSWVNAIVPLPDGRLMIGGCMHSYDGEPVRGMVRILQDGGLDPTYQSQLGFLAVVCVNMIHPLANGDILVGGRFDRVQSRFRVGIARLTSDGVLVDGFNPGRGPGGLLRSMALMSDGRIAIAGEFVSYNDEPRAHLAFLDPNGLLHPVFDGGTGPNAQVEVMVPLQNDRLFVAGRFTQYDDTAVPGLAVVDAFGALVQDVSFSADVLAGGRVPTAAAALPDGSLILASRPGSQPGVPTPQVLRLLPNGAIDPNFNAPFPMFGSVTCILPLADGRILLGGSLQLGTEYAPRGLACVLPDGSVDPTFQIGQGFLPAMHSWVGTLVQRGDGRILAGGYFSQYRTFEVNNIVCIELDGSPCADFITTGATSSGLPTQILSLAMLPDDRAVAVGLFTAYNGTPCGSTMVIMPDGGHDASFIDAPPPEYAGNPWLRQVLPDANGNYLVHGSFHRIGGVSRHRIARLIGGGGVGITEASSTPSLHAWPNPASDVLQLSEPFTGAVIDMQGRTMLEVARSRLVPVQQLAPGAYMLRSQEGYTVRFVKQ